MMNNKDKLSTVASSRSLPYKNQVTGSTNIKLDKESFTNTKNQWAIDLVANQPNK